jgi:curved DNA-binding protein CbpA
MDKEFLFSCRILGVSEHFTYDELKNTYRQCVAKYHPDLYVNAPAHEKRHAEDIMKQINDAYKYLKSTSENTQYRSSNSSTLKGKLSEEELQEILKKSILSLPPNQMLNIFNRLVEQWNTFNDILEKARISHTNHDNNVDTTYIYLTGIKNRVIDTLRNFIEFALNFWPKCGDSYDYLSKKNFDLFETQFQSNIDWLSNLTEENQEIFFAGEDEAVSIFVDNGWCSLTPFKDYVRQFIGHNWE